jgi:pSer/pThr/pTyr-binding forkhead associated (FHA) protein
VIVKVLKNGEKFLEEKLDLNNFTLGREENCDLTIRNDNIALKFISFDKKDENTLYFKKLSRFGDVFKDGEKIKEGELKVGESLSFLDFKLFFECEKLEDKKEEEKVNKEIDEDETKEEIKEENNDEKTQENELDEFSIIKKPDLSEEKVNDKIDKDETKDEEIEKDTNPDAENEEKKDKETKEEKVNKETDEEDTNPDAENEEKQKKPAVEKEEIKKQTPSDATVAGNVNLNYKLVALSGPYKGKVFNLIKPVYILGRSKQNDIILVDDMVSRQHARIFKKGLDFSLEDLGSANGVKINGRNISGVVTLLSSDVIEIGSSTFRYTVVNPLIKEEDSLEEESVYLKDRIKKIEKVFDEDEVKKIEDSYKESFFKNKKALILVGVLIIVLGFILFTGEEPKKEEPKEEAKKEIVIDEEKLPEEENECLEPSLCHLSLGVQRQLLAEYDVGVQLYKNFQYELAEDRATQILNQAPNWAKAIDLLDLASKQKKKLLEEKKKAEEEEIRRMLEEKLDKLLKKVRKQMEDKEFEKVESTVAEIFELDPNNEEAKKMVEQIFAEREKRRLIKERQEAYKKRVNKYKNILSYGKKLKNKKEYLKAIDQFSRCYVELNNSKSKTLSSISSQCKNLKIETKAQMKEELTPELTVAEELFIAGQYKQAIDAYKRVLKIDYKNKLAKRKIRESKKLLTEEAKRRYSEAIISESVSDFKNACRLYYSVIEIAIPGTKYYKQAMEKTKKYCTSRNF